MRICPFPISTQRLPWRDAEMARRFDCVRRDAERRLAGKEPPIDARRGLGIVFSDGELRSAEDTLGAWNWRSAHPDHHPAWLDAQRFVDDPLGASPSDSLAARAAAASAFAEAANAFFKPADGRFVARPLEVVRADRERAAGIYAGADADVLAVDLMEGLSNAQVVDRLVAEKHGGEYGNLSSMLCSPFDYVEVWHRLERLKEVRAMLDPSLPPLRLPSLAAMRKRVKVAYASLVGHLSACSAS